MACSSSSKREAAINSPQKRYYRLSVCFLGCLAVSPPVQVWSKGHCALRGALVMSKLKSALHSSRHQIREP